MTSNHPLHYVIVIQPQGPSTIPHLTVIRPQWPPTIPHLTVIRPQWHPTLPHQTVIRPQWPPTIPHLAVIRPIDGPNLLWPLVSHHSVTFRETLWPPFGPNPSIMWSTDSLYSASWRHGQQIEPRTVESLSPQLTSLPGGLNVLQCLVLKDARYEVVAFKYHSHIL